MESELGWIIEQQTRALDETQRLAQEELRCENGSLRQQLLLATIREDALNKKMERQRGVEQELWKQLADVERRGLRSQDGNDLRLGQRNIGFRCGSLDDEPKDLGSPSMWQSPDHRNAWVMEQQRLYSELQIKQVAWSPSSDVNNQHPSSVGIPDEPPPPYELHGCSETRNTVAWENNDHQQQESQDHRRVPRVRFASTPDIIQPIIAPQQPIIPQPVITEPPRRKESKKSVVGLCRKRSNRTAV